MDALGAGVVEDERVAGYILQEDYCLVHLMEDEGASVVCFGEEGTTGQHFWKH